MVNLTGAAMEISPDTTLRASSVWNTVPGRLSAVRADQAQSPAVYVPIKNLFAMKERSSVTVLGVVSRVGEIVRGNAITTGSPYVKRVIEAK